jgi:hypothetical protein
VRGEPIEAKSTGTRREAAPEACNRILGIKPQEIENKQYSNHAPTRHECIGEPPAPGPTHLSVWFVWQSSGFSIPDGLVSGWALDRMTGQRPRPFCRSLNALFYSGDRHELP